MGGDVVIISGNFADLTGISQRFIDELLAYCSSNSLIKKVVLFGSRARGDFHLRSDIDLAIYKLAKNASDLNHEMNWLRIGLGLCHVNYPTYARSTITNKY
ncbi:nucleotidyltransferase domain-containing protein [Virgibacillus sp. FSP13]